MVNLTKNNIAYLVVCFIVIFTVGYLLFAKGSGEKNVCSCPEKGIDFVTIHRQDLLPYVPRPFIKRTQEELMEKVKRHEIKLQHWPWHYFESTYECKMGEDRIGHAGWDDGGKWICGMSNLLQRPKCIVYSMGSNGQHDFEDDIMMNTDCEIHTFDMGDFTHVFNGTRVHFHQSKIGDGTDGTKSIYQWMQELHHDHIDVLKTDIEMAEYPAYADLSSHEPQPWIGQVLVEFHLNNIPWLSMNQAQKYEWMDKIVRLHENIRNLGLVQYHREDNPFGAFCTEFCFGNLRPRPPF